MKYSKIKPFAEDFKDPNNINVIIERSPMSKVSDSAEGLYVLPNITNCVNISDLIYSLVKMPILLYLSGQDVTHNYTPISMFSSFFENDCLYFVYTDKYERHKNSILYENYIQGQEIDLSGPAKVILKPKNPQDPIQKIQI